MTREGIPDKASRTRIQPTVDYKVMPEVTEAPHVLEFKVSSFSRSAEFVRNKESGELEQTASTTIRLFLTEAELDELIGAIKSLPTGKG